MPELRQDPVSKYWVIIATERAKRPLDFKAPAEEKKGSTSCPFCPGNEKETPPEVMAFREEGTKPDTPNWRVRVVPNKFAALSNNAEPSAPVSEGLYSTMAGIGAHEVIIEGTEHNTFFPDLPSDHAVLVLKAWRQRYLQLKQDKKLKYIQLFKNHGRPGGASLEHPHSQLIATPLVPAVITNEISNLEKYQHEYNSCLICDLIKTELETGSRIVALNEEFIALCPFASRFPMETWVLPRRHQSCFDTVEDGQLEQMACILQEVLGQLKEKAKDPPFNLVLHSAPLHNETAAYHWHLELLPRLTNVAGFEWGTGMFINPTPPEIAARFLKKN